MAVHKKHEEVKEPSLAKASAGKEEKVSESVVVSDVVTETTERVEVIEEVTPEPESAPAEDPSASSGQSPLTDFKEKMSEEEETPMSDMGPKKNFMWPILFVFVIALLMLSGIFVYKKGMITSEKVNVVTLSPSPTLTPQPTKTVDLAKYEIEILNGSSISGEAGRQRTSLEAEGFTVASIGNADSSDYTDTIIQAKEEVDKDFIAKLKSVLEKSFVVGEIEELPQDADSDVVVILGSETN